MTEATTGSGVCIAVFMDRLSPGSFMDVEDAATMKRVLPGMDPMK